MTGTNVRINMTNKWKNITVSSIKWRKSFHQANFQAKAYLTYATKIFKKLSYYRLSMYIYRPSWMKSNQTTTTTCTNLTVCLLFMYDKKSFNFSLFWNCLEYGLQQLPNKAYEEIYAYYCIHEANCSLIRK